MPLSIPDAPVNDDGLLTERHVASHHQGDGEVTLCGLYIDYRNFEMFKYVAPGAPMCAECARLDV